MAAFTVQANPNLSPVKPMPKPPILKPTLGLSLTQPTYGGSGCIAGTASITADVQGRIKISNSNFSVSGREATSVFERVACAARVNIKVAKGYKAVVKEINNAVESRVAPGDAVNLTQTINLVGGAEPKALPTLSLKPSSKLSKRSWKSALIKQNLLETNCDGVNTILAVNTNVLLTKPSVLPTATLAAVTSTQLQVVVTKCK